MGLTQKQEAFAQNIAAGMSNSDAYRAAYNSTTTVGRTIWQEASRLRADPHISGRIAELQAKVREKVAWTIADTVNWHLSRALAPRHEICRVARGACRYCHGDGHLYQWTEPEFIERTRQAEQNGEKHLPDIGGGFGFDAMADPHPDCPSCCGRGIEHPVFTPTDDLSQAALAAYDGVKVTRNGMEVLMADPIKEMTRVAELLGFDIKRIADVTPVELPEHLATLPATVVAETYKRMIDGGVTAH